ncbi:tRNA N6-adenosine threonylcarbamoyltransferase [bacterium BMS3Bbin10]|nr:tRNA N6-adenosine threonylcarbamoyltransferase [bacterium BMS3Bbin10]HDL17362.1 tRNA (adenosine(37)-N6)-threonylcarbamoyltransferase complex transferase subunit TsaD [Hyphomicrobiales bacterium]
MTASNDNRELRVLGIETSCDETAAAVVLRRGPASGEILSNLVRSQLDEHAAFGGVVPEIAARAHVEVADVIIKQAMAEAGLGWADLDGVAATAGPGLLGGLLVGLTTAKAIAAARALPLVAVNHLEAHALTVGLSDALEPPYLLLLVSGGHTQLLAVSGVGAYRRLGTTLDDALGEAFDKTAKLLGLPYPGGPEVEIKARQGDETRFDLPRPMVGRAEPHFSFAGLKTALRRRAEALGAVTDQDIADLCASFQRAVCDVMIDRTACAMALYEAAPGGNTERRLVVAGGVAANRALRKGLETLCAERGFTLHVPPAALCTDNGAMIAWAGAERLARGLSDGLDFAARARWPLDPDAAPATGAGVKA